MSRPPTPRVTGRSSRRVDALRRYPALGFLAVAALLATLLPTALNVPLSGPSGLAELAPVPPEEDADQQQGDLSSLDAASSGGLGFGAGAGGGDGAGSGGAGDGSSLGQPLQPNPRLKRCVGDPPRQTEDPLSPPCVAFWEGDNGGATTTGVTGDEIVVVLHWGSAGGSRAGTFVDYGEPLAESDSGPDRVGKVYARYFTDRYQLYGRRLRLLGYHGHDIGNGRASQAAAADLVDLEERRPFAVLPLVVSTSKLPVDAARRGMVVATYQGFRRADYEAVAPRLFSYAPSLEEIAAISGDYWCRRLHGRPARFGGPEVQRSTRRYGLLYTEHPDDPVHGQLARALKAEIATRCGEEPAGEVAVNGTGNETYDQYPAAMTQLRAAGVTTVVPITKSGDPLVYIPQATALGWYPEWWFPVQHGGGPDLVSARTYDQSQWTHAFGVSFDYRRGRIDEQPWYVAFRDACPDCAEPPGLEAARSYEALALLLYGIQSAGPELTPAKLDRGLHAIPERPSTSPFVPATYFRPGEYSFVKDAKEMWWDPNGSPPGTTDVGCYRMPRDGARARVGEWPAGDDGLFVAGQPCQGDLSR